MIRTKFMFVSVNQIPIKASLNDNKLIKVEQYNTNEVGHHN